MTVPILGNNRQHIVLQAQLVRTNLCGLVQNSTCAKSHGHTSLDGSEGQSRSAHSRFKGRLEATQSLQMQKNCRWCPYVPCQRKWDSLKPKLSGAQLVLASAASNAYNNCMQYTIRKVPSTLDEALRQAAREQGKSLNEVAIEAMARGAGVTGECRRQRDLSDIAGTWRKDRAFDEAKAAQDTIDERIWP